MEQWKHIDWLSSKILFVKFFIWIIITLLVPIQARLQENLLTNPSFENFTCFPKSNFDISCVKNVLNINHTTIDIFNLNQDTNQYYGVGVPKNFAGYQFPKEGESYIGIVTLSRFFTLSLPYRGPFFSIPDFPQYSCYDYIEVVGMKIDSPLIKDKIYQFSLYYSVADNIAHPTSFNRSWLLSNCLDAFLLQDTILDIRNPYLYGRPIFQNTEILRDTSNWVKITTCFKAEGTEKAVAVGCIRDTTKMFYEEYVNWGYDLAVNSYLYLDAFSLTECDTCCLGEFPYTDHLTIKGNPGSSGFLPHFEVLLNPNTTATLGIYDSAGRLVFSESFHNLYTDYKPQQQLAGGVYHYRFATSNGVNDVGKVLVVP